MRPSPGAEPGSRALSFAAAGLGLTAGLHLTGVLALALGGGPSAWLLLPAAACAAFLAAGCLRASGVQGDAPVRAAAGALLAALLGASAALAASAWFYDVSWDGQAYHQQAVMALAEGWNPLRDGPLSLARPDNLWINHYPKGAWIAEASLLRATGSLEAAKGLQLVALLAAGLFAYATLRARGLAERPALLVAVLLAANPVTLAQLASFYVDGLAASLLLSFLALALHPRGRAGPLLAAQAAALLLLVNTKFTALVYAVVLVLAVAALRWLVGSGDRNGRGQRRQALRAGLVTLAAVVVGAAGLGYDPYVTNWRRHGHPFHPIMGAQPVDFLAIQLAPAFHRKPRLTRLLQATFARASNRNEAPRVKAPWVVGRDELEALAFADLRIGGFGPLWGLAVLAAAALSLALVAGRRGRGRAGAAPGGGLGGLGGLAALGAVVAGSALLNPACWWARYVPQLWLLPVGALLAAFVAGRSAGSRAPALRPARALATALAAVLILNVGLVAGAAVAGQWRASAAVRAQLAGLAAGGQALWVRWNGFEANRARLDAAGVSFLPARQLSCLHPQILVASQATFCAGDGGTAASGQP
jgi:hypothetical protein